MIGARARGAPRLARAASGDTGVRPRAALTAVAWTTRAADMARLESALAALAQVLKVGRPTRSWRLPGL